MTTVRNQRLTGRLELTWTNKDQRLLSHSEDTYEWTTPDDHRVSEVRLLHSVDTVGATRTSRERAKDNLLIQGDALHALTALTDIPEFAAEYRGKVKLVYIDPPFNTGQMFEQYNDAVEHSIWLTQMRDRLTQIKQLLAPEGSVWLHCDDYEQHRVRLVLDEVFGADKFVATILWQKRYSRDNRPAIGAVHDFIHVYAPSGGAWKNHRNRLAREGAKEYRNPNDDPRGAWRAVPMTAQGFRPNQMYEITTPSGAVHVPPKGRCWSVIRERYEERLAAGRIYFGKNGSSQPNLIRYLDEDQGLVPWTWWPHDEVGHNDEGKKEMLTLFKEREAFATPKPERLMRRVIEIATAPGDIVLDCFAGSGTTAAVAHKMGRRWVTAELNATTVENFVMPRLSLVVAGKDDGGVTTAVGWPGGEGFRRLVVAQSMFETDDDGSLLLAEWVTNGKFAEAVAAQLGYEQLGPDCRPFSGSKGRMRLAVIDGVVGEAEVDFLVASLEQGQRLLLVAKAATEEAAGHLRAVSPGSRLRQAPRDLLRARAHGRTAR